jgi:hypothetical protein
MKFATHERIVLAAAEFWESTAEQLREVFNAAPIRKRVKARKSQVETVSNRLDESDEPEEIEAEEDEVLARLANSAHPQPRRAI